MSFSDEIVFTDVKCECKNCKSPKRHPGCHDTCDSYINWKKSVEENKLKVKEEIQKDRLGRPLTRQRRRKPHGHQ